MSVDVIPACTLVLTAEALSAWRDSALPATESERIRAHLATCDACRTRLAHFDRLAALARLPVPLPPGGLGPNPRLLAPAARRGGPPRGASLGPALARTAGPLAAVLILALLAALLFSHLAARPATPVSTPTPTAPGPFRSFALPTPNAGPNDLERGPDGNFWFTEFGAGKVGRITPGGVITEFAIPTPASQPGNLTVGPDGNLWFAEWHGNAIGRITPGGVITEFAAPPNAAPYDIVAGPDGNLWFTENRARDGIGRITPGGAITEYTVDEQCDGPTFNCTRPKGITVGPDGALWFTMAAGAGVGRITTGGVVTTFPTRGHNGTNYIVTGADGNLWLTYTEDQTDNADLPSMIGRMTPAGALTELRIPTPACQPAHLLRTADDAIWFGEVLGDKLGRIAPDGRITEVPLPIPDAQPYGIAPGPNGTLWIAAYQANRIVVYSP